MSLLEVKNLQYKFRDGTEALKGVSVKIEKGDFIVLAGKNGSGKTVFLRHLNGLYTPTQGEILFQNRSIYKQIKKVRQNIGMVFQDADSQIVSQTVWDDTAFGPKNLGLSKEEINKRVTESLTSVGLLNLKDQVPHNLSGGEKRKLAIAGILAMDPTIIILDEPFTNLDYSGIVDLLKQIVKLHKNGHTIICVTHEIEKVLFHANRFLIMDKGIIAEDTIPEKGIFTTHKYGITPPLSNTDQNGTEIVKEMTWLK